MSNTGRRFSQKCIFWAGKNKSSTNLIGQQFAFIHHMVEELKMWIDLIFSTKDKVFCFNEFWFQDS